jgi:hypothetical protein
MLVLETVAKIRRAYFVQQKTIKAICRELRVSRKVVRKVLRSETTEFRYERSEQPLPRIGPWQNTLDGMLTSNEVKPVRERLTLIRVFEALRGSWLRRRLRCCAALCPGLAARPRSDVSWRLHSA